MAQARMPVPGTRLSPSEVRIVALVAEGRSNAEIGKALTLSPNSVKSHLRRIFRKLGARDRAHVVALLFAPHGFVVCEDSGLLTPRPALSPREHVAALIRSAAAVMPE